MGYRLGIDLGTTYTAAAVAVDGEVSMVTLGSVTPETPTVVAIDRDDQWLFGDRAVRLAAVHPERVAREFKRRVGDPVPVTVAGHAIPVDDLLSATLRHVVDAAVEQMGELPESTTVTYPAGWGAFKKTQLRQSLEQADVPIGRLVSEPVAAAAHYLHTRMLEPGATIAVFDFGGGTFDAAVLEHSPNHSDRFVLRGEAQGLERLGGVDLDAAIFDFVVRTASLDLVEIETVEEGRRAIRRLRYDVVEAKEGLSEDTFTAITVALPDNHLTLRLTRSEFEDMVRPVVDAALETVEQTISSAGLAPTDLDGILLVGGSSRIPIVAQMVGAHFNTNIVVDAHPKHAVAAGAATFDLVDVDAPPKEVAVPLEVAPSTADQAPDPRQRRWLLVSLIAAAALAVFGLIAAVRGDSGDDTAADSAANAADLTPGEAPGSGTAGDLVTDGTPAVFADLFGAASRSETGGRLNRHDVRRYSSDGPGEAPLARWSADRTQEAYSGVLGTGGLVFSIDRNNRPDASYSARMVRARDQASGEEVWSLDIDGATDLTLVDDALFVSRPNGIDVVEWRTGEVRGELTGLTVTPGSVLVRDGLALVTGGSDSIGSAPNVIAVIDTRTSQLMWRHDEPPARGSIAFTADNDTLVYATDEFTVAFEIKTGNELWRTSDFDAADVVLLDDNVLVLNGSDDVKGVDAKTGKTMWSRADRVIVAASDGVNLMTAHDDGTIESFSLTSGQTTWTNDEFAETPAVAVAVGSDKLFAATTDGGLLAVALATGATVWATDIGDISLGTISDIAVSVADSDLIVANAKKFFLVSGGESTGSDAAIPAEAASPSTVTDRNETVIPADAVSPSTVMGDGDVVVSAQAGFSPASASFVEPGPVAEPSLLWAVERTSDTSAAVAAGGLVIYVDERAKFGQAQSVLIGADAASGREQWSTSLRGLAFSVHVVNENVIVHTTDGFSTFELSTGHPSGPILEDSFPPGNDSFVVRDGALVLAKNASGANPLTTIESIDLETGASNWQFLDEVAASFASRVVFGDSVVVMSTSESLVGVDLATGDELWRKLTSQSERPGVFVGDRFLFDRGSAELAIVDGRTGRDVTILNTYASNTVSDGVNFYMHDLSSQSLQRRSIADGSRAWSAREIDSSPLVAMVVTGGPLYVVERRKMTALKTSDGSLIWSMTLDAEPNSFLYGAVGADVIALTDGARISVFG